MPPFAIHLSVIFGALGPIFFVIGLGYVLRRSQFPGEAFWPAAEKLTYYLLFPALLVHRLALADFSDYAVGPLAIVIVTSLALMTLLLFIVRMALKVDGPTFGSIYQGSIRFNTYVGLAAALALFNRPGATLAALAIAICIPLVNVLSVAVLTHARGTLVWGSLPGALFRNPLILACVIGIGLNVSRVGLPLGSETVLDILARAALPLGLLAVGAALRLRVAFTRHRELLASSALKLLVFPALTYGLGRWVGLDSLEMAILVLFAALPGAPSAYILARQLGGDADLMAAIVTLETGLSMITLPAILLLMV